MALMKAGSAALLAVDVQKRLVAAIHDGRGVASNCAWLARIAVRIGVPVVVTEHFPDKIGPTVDELRLASAGADYVGKQAFSAYAEGRLAGTAVQARHQTVVCGVEAHVCVLQTALDLQAAGKQVFVVADACGSRDPADRELAFARLRARGVDVVSREMVAFEWLERGGTELFREISRDFIR